MLPGAAGQFMDDVDGEAMPDVAIGRMDRSALRAYEGSVQTEMSDDPGHYREHAIRSQHDDHAGLKRCDRRGDVRIGQGRVSIAGWTG